MSNSSKSGKQKPGGGISRTHCRLRLRAGFLSLAITGCSRLMEPRLVKSLALLGVLVISSCSTWQHVSVPMIDGVGAIQLWTGRAPTTSNPSPAWIRDRRLITGIVSFFNARRNSWYDAKGHAYSPGLFWGMEARFQLVFYNTRGAEMFVISFGDEGMVLGGWGRVKQRFLIYAPQDNAVRSAAELCKLLGANFDRESCRGYVD